LYKAGENREVGPGCGGSLLLRAAFQGYGMMRRVTATPPAQHCPRPKELDDLQLLSHGVITPSAFTDDPADVTLALPHELTTEGSIVELVDPEGVPLARVTIENTYAVDDERTGVVGPVEPLSHTEYGAFRRLHLSPEDAREHHPDAITVPVAGPLTEEDLRTIQAHAADKPVMLLAFTGAGTPSYQGRPMSGVGLIRATLEAARLLHGVGVVAVPVASRGDAEADQAFGERVAHAYATGTVVGVTGDGDLPGSIAAIVDFELPPPGEQGLVVFFTGLSGSGKSTLARALHDVLLEGGERTITSLDGDVVRRNLSTGLTFSKADRETNIRRIGWVAAEISRHGGVAICSPIAPFDETRQQVRHYVADAGGAFVLIHVATPVEECERRDRKGLYAKARRGEIPEFTGISSPYQEPTDAAVVIDTTDRSIDDCLGEILETLRADGHL
jgi:sulfate adenylyltransferase